MDENSEYSMEPESILRPWSKRIFKSFLILNTILFVILGIIRGYGLFGPSSVRILILWNFFIMWFLPMIFLTKLGRNKIGLKMPEKKIWFIWAFLLGIGISTIYFLIGFGLYQRTIENWFVDIGMQFLPADILIWGMPKIDLFFIVTLPAVIFSPIGEEFFFRGMIHESVKPIWSDRNAMIVNALSFSGIHILHHGLLLSTNGIRVLWISGMIFFALMFIFSWILTECRKRSGSIWPAVIAHAAFNFVMNLTLFLFLVPF